MRCVQGRMPVARTKRVMLNHERELPSPKAARTWRRKTAPMKGEKMESER